MEACWAHNPEVRGSKPRSAKDVFLLSSGNPYREPWLLSEHCPTMKWYRPWKIVQQVISQTARHTLRFRHTVLFGNPGTFCVFHTNIQVNRKSCILNYFLTHNINLMLGLPHCLVIDLSSPIMYLLKSNLRRDSNPQSPADPISHEQPLPLIRT